MAATPGFVAVGVTDGDAFQRIFAHELAHDFGLDHRRRRTDAPGWDLSGRLGSAQGRSSRRRALGLHHITVTDRWTHEAWIPVATIRYLASWARPSVVGAATRAKLTSKIEVFCAGETERYDMAAGLPLALPPRQPLQANVAVVAGVFAAAGDLPIELALVTQFPWLSEPTLPAARGRC